MLDRVKSRLDQLNYEVQPSGNEDAALLFMIDKIEKEIEIFCNIKAIPDDLTPMTVDKVCDSYLQQLKAVGGLTGYNFEKGVKSITEGDSSFTFMDDEDPETTFSKYILWLIDHEDDQLIAFRKLRW
ncbi:MAG: hypothetical protein VB031_03015 [Eubacteriaceae bacterium]|nr:hypothetical protein [Eubacteriaceae bacterium]